MNHLFTLKSKNKKTGPIPVTTTSIDTCGEHCPFYKNGCYAMAGPLGMIWGKLSITKPGDTFKNGRGTIATIGFADLCLKVVDLPKNQLWRHNQAGDLPGKGPNIDVKQLDCIVQANVGKRGFSYTHKPLTPDNLRAIKNANKRGFTINISANSAHHADDLLKYGLPVVAVLPMDTIKHKAILSPAGNKITICPAMRSETISCATCQLCQKSNRSIIGFPAHGASKRKANDVSTSKEPVT